MNEDFSISTTGNFTIPHSMQIAAKTEADSCATIDTRDTVAMSGAAKEALSASKAGKKQKSGKTKSAQKSGTADPTPREIRKAIRDCLGPEMLKGKYKKMWTPDKPKSWGNCYVASEAYYHLMGGKNSGLKPYWVKHENSTHHFLKDTKTGEIYDLTSDQFKKHRLMTKGHLSAG